MSSMIIPIGFGGAGASGGGSFIIVSGVTVADLGGRTVVVSLDGEELFNATVPSNVQSVSFTITEAGVYTITVSGMTYTVNVTTLTANYMVTVGQEAPPIKVFTSNGTYVPKYDTVYVTACGGGGGGNYRAGGGGGDAVVNKRLSVTPGQSYAITIGTGGNGNTSSTGNGSSGGSTKFGSLLTLAGGGGATYDSSKVSIDNAEAQMGIAGGEGAGGKVPTGTTYHTGSILYNSALLDGSIPSYNKSTYGSTALQERTASSNQYRMGGVLGVNGYTVKYTGSSTTSANLAYFGGGGSLGIGGFTKANDLNDVASSVAPKFGGGGAPKCYCGFSSDTSYPWIAVSAATASGTMKGANGIAIVSDRPLSDYELQTILGIVPKVIVQGSGNAVHSAPIVGLVMS